MENDKRKIDKGNSNFMGHLFSSIAEKKFGLDI